MPPKKQVSHRGRHPNEGARPSLGSSVPTTAQWASGYGWVEFGIDGRDRPFARALDEGGQVWEGEGGYGSLDDALQDMEEGLARFMEEAGFTRKPPTRTKAPRSSVKEAPRPESRARKTPPRTEENPALKKVVKLEEIAEALRQGEQFSITRLTILKGLCEDRRAAGQFALFLARKAQKKLKEEKKAPEHYRKLVDRAIREMKPFLDDPAEERKERLYELLREMVSEQDEHKNISWGAVRIIKSMDLLVAEKCVRAVLRPEEAPFWLYQAARDYCERYSSRYGTGLIPSSAPMVKEVAGFWRNYFKGNR
jgi:hypothetical protein